MITWLVISSLIGGCIVIISEVLRTNKLVSNETSRKVIHIAHALVVAIWVVTMTYSFIIATEVLFLVVVLLARRFKIMQPLRGVNRRSWGDIFFPLGVITALLLMPSKLIFLAAILHLGIADALAALVGRRFKRGEYHVLGQRKTLAGSGTFFIISMLIIIGVIRFSVAGYPLTFLIFIPFITTLIENVSPFGSDNFTLPLVVVGLLSVSLG